MLNPANDNKEAIEHEGLSFLMFIALVGVLTTSAYLALSLLFTLADYFFAWVLQ